MSHVAVVNKDKDLEEMKNVFINEFLYHRNQRNYISSYPDKELDSETLFHILKTFEAPCVCY